MTFRPFPRIFQERLVPARATLVGWSALITEFSVKAPLKTPTAISDVTLRDTKREMDGWKIYDARYAPANTLAGHLTFALRYEGVDLLVLKRLLTAAPKREIEELVLSEPTGAMARRVWFFYEWLTDEKLNVPDAGRGNYVDAIDPAAYFTSLPANSTRHRVRNNLLGNREFCPMVRRTPTLDNAVGSHWDVQTKDRIGGVSTGVIARAASFMLLADTQASYQIEGERPPRNRLERWMRAVSQAGKYPLSVDELERLQTIVIEEDRFIKQGLRDEDGFIGVRDRENNPLPEFVPARHEDVKALIEGIIDAGQRMAESGVDAVVQATIVAFGFVAVHPFVDGNGRLHRYLIHHVLAERGFTPAGLIFPVSTVLLDREADYAAHLRNFTGPLLPYIEWVPTAQQNVSVLNDTADLYRYGDYTSLSEFLYACIIRTVEEDLPKEIAYLASYDEAKQRIQDLLEMPDSMIGSLITFVSQNNGQLSKKRRNREFVKLTDKEVANIEQIIADAFEPEDHESTQNH
ncbi:Fic family protein [Rhizobium sp. VS19-DR104.2]|uniref:Fic family protein n=1 Tax=unclassified Rhizobium TaxID=2613769 RepID=UPI001CC4E87A|nr:MULTISPECIES: Fic family protein [unclassified Rhizobium]MBZ5762413.1 Fic family protein [Rhizobium sp. VS19-DR96]MBZ5768436.1 Fic family protein [Rhizobium sp. VS19-DR129.2]MBZ5776090.1 Fic family protein [Rhizobium sp. VS19-DRK62.2]MBZ5786219.1 Fic family protein [Rhizobium sp. VS19-DR121]MBZ5804491.1 Fic family protein [Rhizobium sp. VS19-DR181]